MFLLPFTPILRPDEPKSIIIIFFILNANYHKNIKMDVKRKKREGISKSTVLLFFKKKGRRWCDTALSGGCNLNKHALSSRATALSLLLFFFFFNNFFVLYFLIQMIIYIFRLRQYLKNTRCVPMSSPHLYFPQQVPTANITLFLSFFG